MYLLPSMASFFGYQKNMRNMMGLGNCISPAQKYGVTFGYEFVGSSIGTLLHGKINPKDWQVPWWCRDSPIFCRGCFRGLWQTLIRNFQGGLDLGTCHGWRMAHPNAPGKAPSSNYITVSDFGNNKKIGNWNAGWVNSNTFLLFLYRCVLFFCV